MTQHGDRGLCLFCCRLEREITSHFTSSHPGCGMRFPEGFCGEIQGTINIILIILLLKLLKL